MHPDLRDVAQHMQEIGLGSLAQAQKNAFFWHYVNTLDEGIFGVLQAAHAAEILIKAAIAEQHPLLIFKDLPKSVNVDDLLDIQSLFEYGKTIDYNDLPERLWATTGYKISEVKIFNSFGKLRNTIQHFAVPNKDLSQETGTFIYKVIDPLLERFWDLYAIQYCDDEEPEYNLLPTLIRRGIDFRFPDEWKVHVEQAREDVRRETGG